MGTYYEYVNYDKKEVVDLPCIANIKSGAFSRWSLQTAILNTFLGFSWPGSGLDLKGWCGRWAGDRIELQNDATDYEGEKSTDEWLDVDAGMMFLSYLKGRGTFRGENALPFWFKWAGLEGFCSSYTDEQLSKWEADQVKIPVDNPPASS